MKDEKKCILGCGFTLCLPVVGNQFQKYRNHDFAIRSGGLDGLDRKRTENGQSVENVHGLRKLTDDVYSARSSRRDNDANLLTMGERVIGPGAALEVLRAWVAEPFSGCARRAVRDWSSGSAPLI